MTYKPPFVIEHRPSNFPNAWPRTFAPRVLQVVHVTGNSRVAAYPEGFDPGESPGADWAYAAKNSASKDGPSAHDYVGRKTGATIEMWNPRTHVAWSNGDLIKPNTKLAGVAYLAGLKARGINANRGCYREIELSGYPGSYDPTNAQIEVCAYFAAIDSIATGLDIVRGVTVLTHADINSVDRQNCAFRPVIRESRLAVICRRALEIKALLTEVPDVKTTITVLPFGGHFTIPTNAGVTGYKIAVDGTIDTKSPKVWPPRATPSTAAYDATMTTDATTGNPFIRCSTGFFAGYYVSSAQVVEAPDAPPAVPQPDCTDAVAAEHERTRSAAIAAVEGI